MPLTLRGLLLATYFLFAGAGQGHCQSNFAPPSDPCLPLPPTGLLGVITGPTFTSERAEACAQERKAQWDNYYAQQRAIKEEHEAAAARQQAETQAAIDRQKAEQAEAEERQRREQAERDRSELRARWAAYRTLRDAENSPDNHCKEPATARQIIEEWSSFENFKELGLRAVDIEHLTTTSYDAGGPTMSCHGIFVTNRGTHLIGTLAIRPNVAGDLIASWKLDDSQNENDYDPPPGVPLEADERVTAQNYPPQPTTPEGRLIADSSFSEGLADRQHVEAWLATLSGDEQAGAKWWAANRNVKDHKECATAGVPASDGAAWLAGCMNAQQKLTPVDLKRRSDPEYKKGWNSF